MRKPEIRSALRLSILALLAGSSIGCSTTARYVTAEHWSRGDTFYVGFTEYKETNLVVTRIGKSTAHVMLCSAAENNGVQCKPQLAVDRLLNPDEKYPEPPSANAAPAPDQPAPAEAESSAEGVPNV